MISAVSDRRWLSVLAFLTCAVAMMSAVNLPGALALSERGNPVTVTVAEHEVTHPWVSGARTTAHRYILQRADGSPLGEDLVSHGSGYDDLDEGDSLTVLVDPDGKVPVEVASQITPGTGIGLLVFGVGGMALVLALTAVLPPRKTKPRRGKH